MQAQKVLHKDSTAKPKIDTSCLAPFVGKRVVRSCIEASGMELSERIMESSYREEVECIYR